MNANHFIVRQREVDEIVTRIKFQTQSCAVNGDSGMGKTALLQYLTDKHTLAKFDIDPREFKLFYFCCPETPNQPDYSPFRFWQEVFTGLQAQISDADLKSQIDTFRTASTFDYYAVEEFFFAAKRKQLSIILLLDDFDNLLSNPAFDKDFLWSLKNLANNNIDYNFGLVTTTLTRLSILCHDPNMLTSPFFNIFSDLPLGPFSEAECIELFQSVATDFVPGEKDRQQLRVLSAGIPLLVTLLGQKCRNASELQDIADGKTIPSWNKSQEQRLQRFVQRIWRNSDTEERKLLIALGDGLRRNSFQHLNHEHQYAIMSANLPKWQALMRRGLTSQTDSIFYLFPTIFAEVIGNMVTQA